jgi:hypothetical protein
MASSFFVAPWRIDQLNPHPSRRVKTLFNCVTYICMKSHDVFVTVFTFYTRVGSFWKYLWLAPPPPSSARKGGGLNAGYTHIFLRVENVELYLGWKIWFNGGWGVGSFPLVKYHWFLFLSVILQVRFAISRACALNFPSCIFKSLRSIL